MTDFGPAKHVRRQRFLGFSGDILSVQVFFFFVELVSKCYTLLIVVNGRFRRRERGHRFVSADNG